MAVNLREYGFLRVGTCAPEMKVADIRFNTDKIIEMIDESIKNSCRFLLTPELSITGYTCGDLFFEKLLLDQAEEAVFRLKEYSGTHNITLVVGAPIPSEGLLFNCAVMISDGVVAGIIPKSYLCNNNEYYEERWFSSEFDRKDDFISYAGDEDIPFGADVLFEVEDFPGALIGAELCEDLWTLIPPSSHMAAGGATVILNLSASNEYLGKTKYRSDLTASQSGKLMAAYVYSSCGPGESTADTLFSGHCMIHENGLLLAQTERFRFDSQIIFADVDIERLLTERMRNNSFGAPNSEQPFRIVSIEIEDEVKTELLRKYPKSPFVPVEPDAHAVTCREVFSIQSCALAKRLKHINAKNVVVGISGGLDSTLALLVCVQTFNMLGLDLKGIHAVTMPGFGTSKRTKKNADKMMEALGVSIRDIAITPAVEQHFKDIGHSPENHNIVYENTQARYRTMLLMDIANQTGGIVIGTGDLSEIALGWCTYNGDHMSMYAVNSGIPKTLIRPVTEYLAHNEFSDLLRDVLLDICATPISPELLPTEKSGEIAQKTEQELGPYEIHDFFLYYMVRAHYSPRKILMIARDTFKNQYSDADILKWLKLYYRRFFANQYKRSCVPDGVKVGTIALSPRADWRMPSDASAALWLSDLESVN